MKKIIFLISLLLLLSPALAHGSMKPVCKINGALPDSVCTPGNVQTINLNIICFQSTKIRRNVSAKTSVLAYSEYGIVKPKNNTGKNQKYEVDHLIPLELGGSNDIKNLWPEAAAPVPGFHQKDILENYLHDQVCAGKISVAVAQHEIVRNWLLYYSLLNKTGSKKTNKIIPQTENTTIDIQTPSALLPASVSIPLSSSIPESAAIPSSSPIIMPITPIITPSSGSIPAGATAKCGDSTYSFSQSHKGACSHHGGVALWY